MADTRDCEQCGSSYVPRREHDRFCSARCRVAWSHKTLSIPAVESSALQWSLAAMNEATERLATVRAWDSPRALTMVREAVWWVTIVDATLVRHHPDAYDGVMTGQVQAERRVIERTLGGLRFVRNQIGMDVDLACLIDPATGRPGGGQGHVMAWTWRSVPTPELSSLSPRGRAWELARYRAYQKQLAGHPIAETFGRAAGFLRQIAAKATLNSGVGAHPSR
jgi:endogenous inhibitor of DNA gyrase (YacG/DUF329 family)